MSDKKEIHLIVARSLVLTAIVSYVLGFLSGYLVSEYNICIKFKYKYSYDYGCIKE